MIFLDFCTFWRLKCTKLKKFRAVLAFLDSPKLISRKIWMTGKSWNFHTVVQWLKSKQYFLKPNLSSLRFCQPFRNGQFTMLQKLSNVKLRLDFVEIWWFYCHSYFTWDSILVNSNGSKMSLMAILEILNFCILVYLGLESSSKLLK